MSDERQTKYNSFLLSVIGAVTTIVGPFVGYYVWSVNSEVGRLNDKIEKSIEQMVALQITQTRLIEKNAGMVDVNRKAIEQLEKNVERNTMRIDKHQNSSNPQHHIHK